MSDFYTNSFISIIFEFFEEFEKKIFFLKNMFFDAPSKRKISLFFFSKKKLCSESLKIFFNINNIQKVLI